MRAIAYARVSSEEQAQNYSIPTQLEAIRKYATENNMEIVKEYVDAGVTGSTLDRLALRELREFVKVEQVDRLCVIAYDPDRLSRNFAHLMVLANEFEEAGVELTFVTQSVGNTPEERMLFGMKGLFAEYERTKIMERTARGRTMRVKQGRFPGGASSNLYGYRYQVGSGIGEGIRYIDKVEADIVKKVYSWFLQGDTLNRIVVKLHSLGIPSPLGNPVWNRITVFKMLKNRAYTGVANVCGIEIQQPQIITEEAFEKVTARLKRNRELSRRNSKRQYLLSGYLFCKCGRRYVGSTSSNKGGHTHYYCCSGSSKRVSINPCPARSLRAEDLEDAVWAEVECALLNPQVISKGLNSLDREDYTTELATLKVRLAHMDKEKKRCWNAYLVTGDEDTFTREIKSVTARIEELENRHCEIESRIEASKMLPSIDDIEKACAMVHGNLGNLSFSEKRLCLEALQVRIRVDDKIRLEGVLPIELIPSEPSKHNLPFVLDMRKEVLNAVF